MDDENTNCEGRLTLCDSRINNVKRQICLFYNRGKCENGDDCPYLHETLDDDLQLHHTLSNSKIKCLYYNRGNCQNGDNCPYLHEGSIQISKRAKKAAKRKTQKVKDKEKMTLTITLGGKRKRNEIDNKYNTGNDSNDQPKIKHNKIMEDEQQPIYQNDNTITNNNNTNNDMDELVFSFITKNILPKSIKKKLNMVVTDLNKIGNTINYSKCSAIDVNNSIQRLIDAGKVYQEDKLDFYNRPHYSRIN